MRKIPADIKLNHFVVNFEFSTFHGKGRIVGRSGYLTLATEEDGEFLNANPDWLASFCADFIKSQRPAFNILMITITSIEPKKLE